MMISVKPITALSCQREGVYWRFLSTSTASRLMPLLPVRMAGMANISRPSTNVVMATPMIAGRASGKLTVVAICQVEAPATFAASSRALSKFRNARLDKGKDERRDVRDDDEHKPTKGVDVHPAISRQRQRDSVQETYSGGAERNPRGRDDER